MAPKKAPEPVVPEVRTWPWKPNEPLFITHPPEVDPCLDRPYSSYLGVAQQGLRTVSGREFSAREGDEGGGGGGAPPSFCPQGSLFRSYP